LRLCLFCAFAMVARIMAAVGRGIKLEHRIIKSEPGESPTEEVEPTVFWTWGEAV